MKTWARASRTPASGPLTALWLAAIGLSFRASTMAQCPEVKGDPRVEITSPHEGQTFAPGDTVKIVVRSSVSLAAGYVGVYPARAFSSVKATMDPPITRPS